MGHPVARSRRRRAGGAVGVGVVAVLGYVWGEALLAAPVGFVSARRGAGVAFGVCAPLFAAAGFALSLVARRVHARVGGTGWLAGRLRDSGHGSRGRMGERMLVAGRGAGFVVASVALGGPLTTWVLLERGRTDDAIKLAALSSAIFGVTWAAVYAGLFSVLL